MAADDVDLDRFNDSDSEDAASVPSPGGDDADAATADDGVTKAVGKKRQKNTVAAAAGGAGGGGGGSGGSSMGGGGGGKLLAKRAKKAAAKAARLGRRKEECARFPTAVTSHIAGNHDVDAKSSDDDDDDDADADADVPAAAAVAKAASKAKAKLLSSQAAAASAAAVGDRVHHGTLTVEGVVVRGKLVLLDRKTAAVYSSTRRAPDGTHLRIGTWESGGERMVPLTEEEMQEQLHPTPKSKKKGDGDGDAEGGNGEEENAVEVRMEKPPDHVEHCFAADADDHCETSPEAHANIINFLAKAAEAAGKTPKNLIIYDPYYCAGGTQRSFTALGYPNVINRNEDFYAAVDEDRVPAHDVLVTNPPYSADHVERCLTFAARNLAEHGRPYFLLLPSYVINKPYYVDALLTGGAAGRAAAEAAAAAAEREEEQRADDNGVESEDEEKDSEGEEDERDAGIETERAAEQSKEEEGEEETFKVHDTSGKKKKNGKFVIPGKRKKIPSLESSLNSKKQTLPFYVAPVKRYYYWTPKALIGARREASGTTLDAESGKARRKKHHIGRLGERTSPFLSFWYCGMGTHLQPEALRWHRKLPKAMVMGYTVATHPNDLPAGVLDEWDPRRQAAAAAAREGGGEEGGVSKPKRYAGFSGANCGQNMSHNLKKHYKEFDDKGNKMDDAKGGYKEAKGGHKDVKGGANWGNGKGGDSKEGSMFQRPRKKAKY